MGLRICFCAPLQVPTIRESKMKRLVLTDPNRRDLRAMLTDTVKLVLGLRYCLVSVTIFHITTACKERTSTSACIERVLRESRFSVR